jgi:hypothetical protein
MFEHPRPPMPLHVDRGADDPSGNFVRLEVPKTGFHSVDPSVSLVSGRSEGGEGKPS